MEKRILPVVFFFRNYGMVQDIELKFSIEIVQTLINHNFEENVIPL